jgi:hypothetical protein
MESGFEGLSFESIRDSVFGQSKIPATQLRIRLKSVANFDRSYEDGKLTVLSTLAMRTIPYTFCLLKKIMAEVPEAFGG